MLSRTSQYVGLAAITFAVMGIEEARAIDPMPVVFPDTQYVMMDRSKYIELRVFCANSSNIPIDPDDFNWTIEDGPVYGTLEYIDGATYKYIPDAGFKGTDSIAVTCVAPGLSQESDWTYLNIEVSDAYVPPYGLNAPGFGIENTFMMYHPDFDLQYNYGSGNEEYHTTDGRPYTHYVNFSTGSDSGNPMGTPGSPRKTIPTSTLAAGSIVELHGTETAGSTVVIAASGSSGAPVFIRGASASDVATMKNKVIVQGNYVIFENVDFDCYGAAHGASDTRIWFEVTEKITYGSPNTWTGYHHVCIRHCSFADHQTGVTSGVAAMSFAVSFNGGETYSPNNNTTLIEDCVVYDTHVRNFGNWEDTGGSDYVACNFARNAKRMWCSDSVFRHVQSSGVGLSRNNALSNQMPSQNCYVGRNVMHHIKEYGVNCKMSVNSIISQNKIYRIRKSGSSLGAAVSVLNNDHVDNWPYTDNLWVIFNEIYDTAEGVHGDHVVHGTPVTPPVANAELYVVGNTFNHIQAYGASPSYNFGRALYIPPQFQCRFVNNTVYRCQRGVRIQATGANCSDSATQNTSVDLINNLFLDILADGSYDYHISNYTDSVLSSFDYCLHYGNIQLEFACHATYGSVASMAAASWCSYGDHSMESNPYLADATNLDFHITGSSPHENSGVADSVYSTFESAFPDFPSIEHDYDGNAYSTYYPIGAFQN